MSDQTDREAKLREIATQRMIYTLPGMDALPVHRDLLYRATSGALLALDIYYPATQPGQRVPVVLIPLAFPDPLAGVRAFGPFTSLAQLIAASGMAAVIYGSEAPADDVHAVLGHLRAEAAALDLDATRPGLIALSGNGTVALSALMRDRAIACAALVCGYTMDLDGATAVGDMARQYGFVDACAGNSVDDLPSGVPMFFVRAGQDDSPGLNDAFDRVVVRALARNLPLTLVNYAAGLHRFVWDDDSAISTDIVGQVLAFLAFHLK